MVGVIQIAMGVARLGSLLNFVSHSVILGFTAGAAVLIGFKQIPNLLGLKLEKTSVFVESLVQIANHVHETHLITFALGLGTVAVIISLRKLRPSWPGTLIALVVIGGVVALFKLDAQGVAVIGAIPQSLPPFHFPNIHGLEIEVDIADLAPGALAIAILGLMEAVSIAKSIAGQTHQRLNVNQEFIGQGLSNMAASLFSGYAGSGSFTRSAVNFSSGGKTPMSGVFSGITVAVLVLLAAPLAAKLPVAALAGVLMVVAYGLSNDTNRRYKKGHTSNQVRCCGFDGDFSLDSLFTPGVCCLRGSFAVHRSAPGRDGSSTYLFQCAGPEDRKDGWHGPR